MKNNKLKHFTDAVTAFHTAFNAPVSHEPTLITKDRSDLRFELMREENQEYADAVKDGNLIEVGDALGDMLYILCGTIIEHGMQHKITEVFDEIQASNMSKLGEDGKPILREDGKILKGKNYFKPNIAQFFESIYVKELRYLLDGRIADNK
ncbi:nucleotide pyrophosphohydrolase [Tenacibaculum phage PTm1]|uniref:Nucleoside triphosphate pyrophosphohydrolase n=2 Tax=Shirahamavirus PTm1 TaxID=2846435 RepID=A0A5S9C135_9CAUD|nr:nucleotide pyrophosphohydrolase [Tenacibaculum phage PTm1]BBI90534.1 nucleoside triphosphate pyrophosphohydrolase [Tenacibaculum phage PTm1]BBI90842.1 nucleoside triphosphate pyrophosphohydrolase [Tenacibaculum phage PTm5]